MQRNEKANSELVERFEIYTKSRATETRTNLHFLLMWLGHDGFKDIKNYEHFCELAKMIAAKGYNTNFTIPEYLYNKVIEIANNGAVFSYKFFDYDHPIQYYHPPYHAWLPKRLDDNAINIKIAAGLLGAIDEKSRQENTSKEFSNLKLFGNHNTENKVVQSAATVALLDIVEGYSRPGGSCNIFESDLVEVRSLFQSRK